MTKAEEAKKQAIEDAWGKGSIPWEGNKVALDDLVGETITVYGFTDEMQGKMGAYRAVGIKFNGEKRVIMTGAVAVLRKLVQTPPDLFPFDVKVKKVSNPETKRRYFDIELV